MTTPRETLNYGFHPEVLYAWLIPWALYAALRTRRISFVVAVPACVSVKEDAVFAVFAISMVVGLHRWRELSVRDRLICLLLPSVAGLVNLAVFYKLLVPALSPGGVPTYSVVWSQCGPTPIQALAGMFQTSRPSCG